MTEAENIAVAENYLANFHNTIMQLTGEVAQYIVLCRKYGLTQKTAEDSGTRDEPYMHLPEEQKVLFVQVLDSVIFHVEQVQVMLQGLNNVGTLKINKTKYDAATTKHESLSKKYVLDDKELREYVAILHEIILNSVIMDLLRTSTEYFENVLANKQPANKG
jgi:hypothetical protein